MARRLAAFLLALLAVSAAVTALIFALRARSPEPAGRTPTAEAPTPAARPSASPSGRLRAADLAPNPKPPRPAPVLPAAPPEDDAGYVAWLQARSENDLRADVVALVRAAPGTTFETLNCGARPCQANVHADSVEAWRTFLRLAHARFRGHINVIATIGHPAAPAPVVGSMVIGSEAVMPSPTAPVAY